MTETSDLGHLVVWILIEVMVTHCSRRGIMLHKGAKFMQSCIYKSQVEILGPKIKFKLVLAKSGNNIKFSAPRKRQFTQNTRANTIVHFEIPRLIC